MTINWDTCAFADEGCTCGRPSLAMVEQTELEQLRAELAKVREQLTAANRRADGLHEQNAAAQNALRSLGQAYADLKTDNDELAAENARLQPVVEAAKAVYRADAGSLAALTRAVEALPVEKAEATR